VGIIDPRYSVCTRKDLSFSYVCVVILISIHVSVTDPWHSLCEVCCSSMHTMLPLPVGYVPVSTTCSWAFLPIATTAGYVGQGATITSRNPKHVYSKFSISSSRYNYYYYFHRLLLLHCSKYTTWNQNWYFHCLYVSFMFCLWCILMHSLPKQCSPVLLNDVTNLFTVNFT
jgi:hypothetical protein